MKSTLDLNDVRFFTTACHAGSLSAAAEEMYVPVLTVSRSITRLEKHLGLLLIRRGQKGLELTDAGKAYLTSCKQAMLTLRDGDDLFRRSIPASDNQHLSSASIPWFRAVAPRSVRESEI